MPWFRCDTCDERFYTAATNSADDSCPIPGCEGALSPERPEQPDDQQNPLEEAR